MRLFKYNELEYARQIYNYGFLTSHYPTELRLLVLYYRDVLKMSPKERETELKSFCNRYWDNFALAKDYTLFDKVLRKGLDNKQRLVIIDKIPITQSEFNYISSLDLSNDYKKILFSFLVQNKLNKEAYKIRNNAILDNCYFSGGTSEYREIKDIANVSSSIKIHEVIHDLSERGYINLIHTGKIDLAFLNNIQQTDDIMFYVENYERIGYYFDYYNGAKRVKLCVVCKTPFYAMSNSQTYCKTCEHLPQQFEEDEVREVKVCQKCGKNFYVNSNRQKYCESCSQYSPVSKVEKTCSCGHKFFTTSGNKSVKLCQSCREKRNKTLSHQRYLNRKIKEQQINDSFSVR